MAKILKNSRFVAFCLFLLASYPLSPSHAAEEILSFDSTIVVGADAQISVEEVIHVRAEGRAIRRGIYRDFPIRWQSKSGFWHYVDFDLIEVLRDGKPEPHFTENIGNYIRIYVGDESVFLRTGEYTYTFKYKTARQLRYFDDFDELYWNVTGNFWKFPIRKATARIVLPESANITRKAGYTGGYGATGQNYSLFHDGRNSIGFSTTNQLEPNQGLTISVGWQKGVVAQPSTFAEWLAALWDNLGFAALMAGLFFALRYYYSTWNRIGRDPQKGTIIPLFKPPADLSPAAVSYVHYQGFDRAGNGATKPFIAALVSLATKGQMRISEKGDDLTFENTGDETTTLGVGEASLFKNLLAGRDQIKINKSNGTRIKSAKGAFNSSLLSEYQGVFFKNNLGYFVIGVAISVATFIAFLVFQSPGENQIGWFIVVFVGSAGGTLLLMQGLRRIYGWLPGGGSKILGALLSLVGGGILLALAILTISNFASGTMLMSLAIGALAAMNMVSFFLLRAPTPGGRKVMDDIEGFHMYLSVAEAERMNMDGAPDMSRQLFETYLPYAIGLGVEKPWSDAFTAYLARATPDQRSATGYTPRWYSGSNWNSSSLGRATSGLVSSMSSSMASAMPAPKSSSGSSGGGFSGGGFGGGGGGAF